MSGIFDTGDSAVRVRVTKNKGRVSDGEQPFERIPFWVRLASSRETVVRSRGFKFAAIAAIAGHLSSVRKIIVPESGQGALGPVLLPLHNVYADYRNHPTFFRKMERFIKALLGYSVPYEQPRLWYTKGETIGAFLAQSGIGRESVLSTRSCWQQRWNARFDGRLRQCGLCSACLLRRMSMHWAGVNEPADTYIISDLTASRYKDALPRGDCKRLSHTMVEYGIVGARRPPATGGHGSNTRLRIAATCFRDRTGYLRVRTGYRQSPEEALAATRRGMARLRERPRTTQFHQKLDVGSTTWPI